MLAVSLGCRFEYDEASVALFAAVLLQVVPDRRYSSGDLNILQLRERQICNLGCAMLDRSDICQLTAVRQGTDTRLYYPGF